MHVLFFLYQSFLAEETKTKTRSVQAVDGQRDRAARAATEHQGVGILRAGVRSAPVLLVMRRTARFAARTRGFCRGAARLGTGRQAKPRSAAPARCAGERGG